MRIVSNQPFYYRDRQNKYFKFYSKIHSVRHSKPKILNKMYRTGV